MDAGRDAAPALKKSLSGQGGGSILLFPNRIAIYLSEVTWIENMYISLSLSISLYGVNSDGINRSVHYVHYILEHKRSREKNASRESNPRH